MNRKFSIPAAVFWPSSQIEKENQYHAKLCCAFRRSWTTFVGVCLSYWFPKLFRPAKKNESRSKITIAINRSIISSSFIIHVFPPGRFTVKWQIIFLNNTIFSSQLSLDLSYDSENTKISPSQGYNYGVRRRRAGHNKIEGWESHFAQIAVHLMSWGMFVNDVMRAFLTFWSPPPTCVLLRSKENCCKNKDRNAGLYPPPLKAWRHLRTCPMRNSSTSDSVESWKMKNTETVFTSMEIALMFRHIDREKREKR